MTYSTRFVVARECQSVFKSGPNVVLHPALDSNVEDSHAPKDLGANTNGETVGVDEGEIDA